MKNELVLLNYNKVILTAKGYKNAGDKDEVLGL